MGSDKWHPISNTLNEADYHGQKREFFELYNRSAENIVAMSDRLVELLDRFPDGTDELVGVVKQLEHEGDGLTHELVDLLNRTS